MGIILEAVDPAGDEYSREFLIDKDLDGLADGNVGCSIDDGKAITKQIQKIVVERELDLWIRYRRACPSCEGLLPIKDYQSRKLLTVHGKVSVKFPRLVVCRKCHPAMCMAFSPVAKWPVSGT